MRCQIFSFFCILLCPGAFSRVSRILGGEYANILDFPHVVSLRYKSDNVHFCGGSIITNWHILTAAHCLFPIQKEYHDVKIYTGITSSTSTAGQSFDIARVIIHPQYIGIKSEKAMDHHDIAVIQLKRPINFNEYQNKIDLPTSNIPVGTFGVLTGWGQTSNPGSTSEYLQKISMRIYHNSDCSRYVPFELKNEQFCGFHSRGVGACTGDSGSPLTVDDKIVGIISFTVPCALGYPDIYTNVYSYIGVVRDESYTPMPFLSTTLLSSSPTTACAPSSDTETPAPTTETSNQVLEDNKDNTELQRLASRHYYSTTTALAITVGVGCILLVLNMLIFAGIYYQRDRDKKRAVKSCGSNNGQECLAMRSRSLSKSPDDPCSSLEAPPCYTTLPKSPSSIQEQMMEVTRQDEIERNLARASTLGRGGSLRKDHVMPPRPPQRTSSSLSTGSSTSGSIKKRVQIQEINV